MKKRFAILALATAGFLCGIGDVQALTNAQTGFVSEAGLAYSKTYPLDLDANGIDQISVQATYSSGTFASKTFTDGSASTATITVASVSNLLATAATNTVTVAAMAGLLPASATDQLTILSSQTLSTATIFLNGIALRQGYEWFSQNTASGDAVALMTLINTFPGIKASTGGASGTIVFATATAKGAVGNGYTFTSNNSSITVAGAKFSGGQDHLLNNALLTVNGQALLANRDWLITDTSSGTAASIAKVMNVLAGMTSTNTASVVYATATVAGAGSNAFTLTSNNANLTVGGATFSGGADAAKVVIGGVPLTFGVDIATKSTTALQATEIARAINANASLSPLIVSTAPNGSAIAYATATTVGTGTNYSLTATPVGSLTASNGAFFGGTASAYALNSQTLTVKGHSFPLALPVLYSTGSARGITGLVTGTTYYAVPVDANTIKLATTSAHAVALDSFVTLTSSVTSTAATYTLAPLTITGTPSFKWQASNDNTNWADLTATANNVTISSITFASPYTAASTYWDLGTINAHYIRLNVVGPTTGGLNLTVATNGKGLNK